MIIALVAGLVAVIAATLRRGPSRRSGTSRRSSAPRQGGTSLVTAVVCIALGAATQVSLTGPSGAFPEPRHAPDGARVARIAAGPPAKAATTV